MVEILLKFQDLEYLLKKALPYCKISGFTNKGLQIEVDLSGENGILWKDVVIYGFEARNPVSLQLEPLKICIRKQNIKGQADYQMSIG